MSESRTLRGKAAVVGVGSTPYYKRGTAPDTSARLILRAALAACKDAGADPRSIDGFVSYAGDLNEGLAIGAALGVHEVRYTTQVWGGGGGAVAAAVNAAATAVATGQADRVLVYRGISEVADGRQSYGKGHFPPLLSAHGVLTPAQICALRTQRMLSADAVPASAMEALVLADYHHAQRNPDAVAYGRPLTHEQYLDARIVSEPFRLYDCSRENDGASALLVTSAQSVEEFAGQPAYLLGGVQGAGPDWSESIENMAAYSSAGFHPAMVERLWAEAAIKPSEIDVVQVYENFSGPAVASLIDFGLCPTGPEAGAFMTVHNLVAPTGRLPINTAGGNLAEGFVHGIGLAVEAVRQIRESSTNQVPGADISLLIGGPMAPLVSATVFGSHRTL
ncbi:thiolase C-terminal domain-containing protein [Pseudonocardia spinosispora]|uniref:thiolase C-terminal domain-containing protein n=1 Tax=Pseudonocardia spinosispora TaxID=103441 RepID=UPI00040CA07B|nr:transporter [Pseudonocardia spinosispora]